jgi:hypothetical protein
MTRRSIRAVVLLAFALALAGCASPKLSADQRASLKRLSIGQVQLPEKPTIFGEGAAAAFLMGGPIGLAMANSGSDAPTEFKKALERSKTDVAALVRHDLKSQLARKGFDVVDSADAKTDAVVAVQVIQYGLTGDIFSSPPVRVPALNVRVDFKHPKTGETIWSHWASVHVRKDIMDQLQSRSVAEYFTDQALLSGEFNKASRLVTAAAIEPL